jgi:fermentation-respiration switch protein FrsA (DUF1100 family)
MKHLLLLALLVTPSFAQETGTIYFTRALTLELPRQYAETIVAPNPIEAMLATGKWVDPGAGDRVTFADGSTSTWREITVDANKWKPEAQDAGGWFADSSLRGCYLFCTVKLDEDRAMLLEAMGNEMVYVNSSPRSGNPYGLEDTWESWAPAFNYSRIPVPLHRGVNTFLFRCAREVMKAKLVRPMQTIFVNSRDITAPNAVQGRPLDAWVGIPIVNATGDVVRDLRLVCSIDGISVCDTTLPALQPYSIRKCPVKLRYPAQVKLDTLKVEFTLMRGGDFMQRVWPYPLRVVAPNANRKETFISEIDGSVQYFSVLPAKEGFGTAPLALFLSLHGASVEAINQSGSYAPKTWGVVVSPTNRRPYGFNWEEWGRLDALEVLALAKRMFPIDESRVYLTGHSMGGHGTYHLASLFPDQFAAAGPSAGWISFWTYRFRGKNIVDTSAVRRLIRRSTTPSETFMHAPNFGQMGLYIIHGDQDDNVFPEQSRMMVDTLSKIHRDFVYHEEKGAGHWWDNSDDAGADCVDYPPLFDFFARHARPERRRIRQISFRTANPSVSSRDYWLAIDAQVQQLKMSTIDMRYEPGLNRFLGSTGNVARCSIDLDVADASRPLTVKIDSQTVTIDAPKDRQQIWLERTGDRWRVVPRPGTDGKGAHRYGTFKEAFRNRMIVVYGTKGSREENQWAFDKARYDAERFWYQGNGAIEVVSDEDFDASKEPDRCVILYGNSATNAAWDALLASSPVQVTGKRVTVGERSWSGKNLGCIFVRPREGSATASVGVVSGTGIEGMRSSNRFPYMSPGIGLPDCTVFSTDILTRGDDGILLTGFFGLDWSVERGEFAGRRE